MGRSKLLSISIKDARRSVAAPALPGVVRIHRKGRIGSYLARLVAAALLVGASGLAIAADDGWQAQVGKALGKTGAAMPGGVYRVGLPRTDLKARLDGVALKPGFALGGWLAFEKTGDHGMVMGDIVLTEDEVNPVMA